MKQFSALYLEIDSTTDSTEKVAALIRYLHIASPSDAAWVIYYLSGRKLHRLVSSKTLRQLSNEQFPLPSWLFDACYEAVGDMAETMALLYHGKSNCPDVPLHRFITQYLLPLQHLEEPDRCALVTSAWGCLEADERLVWNKLVMGSFRARISRTQVEQAVAKAAGLPQAVVAERMAGDWQPTPEWFQTLIAPIDTYTPGNAYPFPFIIAQHLEEDIASLGDRQEWLVEWKWEGVRVQLIRRAGESYLWSQYEELISDRFPEIAAICDKLPDGTVLDGELLAWDQHRLLPKPYGYLERRSSKRNPGSKMLVEIPVVLLAYDILEARGQDVRCLPLTQRRTVLEETVTLANTTALLLPPEVCSENWEELTAHRALGQAQHSEGLMLRRCCSAYQEITPFGSCWVWKREPNRLVAVMLSARQGNGGGAAQYSDYTFGVWHDGALIPVASISSKQCRSEAQEFDQFIRQHTTERFGPVRMVEPLLVCEILFDGVQVSTRHKAGLTVRSPRIATWLRDTPANGADSLNSLRLLVHE